MSIVTQNQPTHNIQSMTLVSRLLGDDFVTLLAELPDEFYRWPLEKRIAAWDLILSANNQGVDDPRALAKLIIDQRSE